jgi:Na+/pantothenate symporter
MVHGEAENFFVAGKSLNLWIITFTLGAQSIDSNAILGNADLSYKYHFYDGAALPIGLGLSLILNGLFLARHINAETNVLTLPDVLARRYGKIVEVLVSIATICSFMMLLAGNLVGMGVILAYVWGITVQSAIWTAATIVWAYTVTGGLFSVAYTDVAQGAIGWSGCAITAYYLIANSEPNAPPPSIGIPGYIYPDSIGDGGVCDSYQGIQCETDPNLCCYNTEMWCPSDDNCRTDNGAYPFGDQPVFSNQMGNYLALSPFPNAMFWNWATIFILGFGNLAALDFQARCMAAKTPSIATWGCILGGLITFVIGIPFAYMGAISRCVFRRIQMLQIPLCLLENIGSHYTIMFRFLAILEFTTVLIPSMRNSLLIRVTRFSDFLHVRLGFLIRMHSSSF